MGKNANSSGLLGWGLAAAFGLALISKCGHAPAPTNAVDDAAVKAASRYVSARSLNCRAEPDAASAVVRSLARNDNVHATEENNGWAKIEELPSCWVVVRLLTDAPPNNAVANSGPESSVSPAAAASVASLASSAISRPRSFQSGSSLERASLRTPTRVTKKRKHRRRARASRKQRFYDASGCPCSGSRVCIGPRGGRYCITSGGNKRYGV